jgi:indolepyruvate ferredoxin oxidoreductase
MPVLSPANLSDLVEFGLYGYALSRYSGAWVGLTALSEVVESGGTVDLDPARACRRLGRCRRVRAATGHRPPADGLHYRWPDLPSLRIETRLPTSWPRWRPSAPSTDRPRDRRLAAGARGHRHRRQGAPRLHGGAAPARDHARAAGRAGVRVLKLGLTYPLDAPRLRGFAAGLQELLVIEEKGPVVETQLRALFYNAPVRRATLHRRQGRCTGRAAAGASGELRPSRLIEIVAAWLARHDAALDRPSMCATSPCPSC